MNQIEFNGQVFASFDRANDMLEDLFTLGWICDGERPDIVRRRGGYVITINPIAV